MRQDGTRAVKHRKVDRQQICQTDPDVRRENFLERAADFRLFRRFFVENEVGMSVQREQQQHAEDAAADELADENGQSEEPPRIPESVRVAQDERHDDGVRQDRRDRREPLIPAQGVGQKRADQRGDGAEHDVPHDRAGQDVGKKTADHKPRDCGAREKRQDRQRFGDAELDDVRSGQPELCGKLGQYDIEPRNKRRFGDVCGRVSIRFGHELPRN